MGIHLCVVDSKGRDAAGRDFLRHHGDREFAAWAGTMPQETSASCTEFFRPIDFPRWRASLPPDTPNPKRILGMLNLLENNPDLWVQISY